MNLSKKLLFMALASCAALPAVAKDAQVGTGETDGYRLVWQDLFDDSELRPDRWNIEVTVQAAATMSCSSTPTSTAMCVSVMTARATIALF